MTFLEAKQKVAEKNGFKSWFWFMFFCPGVLRSSREREAIELYAHSAANEAAREYFRFRPVDEWHEDMGDCLFYAVPVCEAPIVTCPLSSDWIEGYFTHFLEMKKFPVPDEDGKPIPGNSRNKYWTPYPDAK